MSVTSASITQSYDIVPMFWEAFVEKKRKISKGSELTNVRGEVAAAVPAATTAPLEGFGCENLPRLPYPSIGEKLSKKKNTADLLVFIPLSVLIKAKHCKCTYTTKVLGIAIEVYFYQSA